MKKYCLLIVFFLFNFTSLNVTAQVNDELLEAVRRNNLDAVRDAITKGAEINARTPYGEEEPLTMMTSDGFVFWESLPGATALMLAVENGNVEIVKTLMANGADINAKSQYGRTALMVAVKAGNKALVDSLLSWKADPNIQADSSLTQVVFSKGLLIGMRKTFTALEVATQNGRLSIVKKLLANGANVNAKQDDGWTSLMTAADVGNIQIVQALLDAGADVNARTNNGRTARNIAKKNRLKDIEELLKKAGAKK